MQLKHLMTSSFKFTLRWNSALYLKLKTKWFNFQISLLYSLFLVLLFLLDIAVNYLCNRSLGLAILCGHVLYNISILLYYIRYGVQETSCRSIFFPLNRTGITTSSDISQRFETVCLLVLLICFVFLTTNAVQCTYNIFNDIGHLFAFCFFVLFFVYKHFIAQGRKL